jgi:hypothetical protein
MFVRNRPATLTAVARIIALALAAVPFVAWAQLDARSDAVAQAIFDEIETLREQRGDGSPELIDPLTRLSLHYEERGDDALALALIDEATHLMHVNHGLHSFDEAPLMQRSIRLLEARGDHEAAWKLEQELLALARRHSGDVRTVSIFRALAEKRLEMLARYVGGEFPPQIVLGCYYSEPAWTSCTSGRKSQVIAAIRSEARRFHAEAALSLAQRAHLDSLCAEPLPPEPVAAACR